MTRHRRRGCDGNKAKGAAQAKKRKSRDQKVAPPSEQRGQPPTDSAAPPGERRRQPQTRRAAPPRKRRRQLTTEEAAAKSECRAFANAYYHYRLEALPKLCIEIEEAAVQRLVRRRRNQLAGSAAAEEARRRHHRADQARAIARAAAAAALVRENGNSNSGQLGLPPGRKRADGTAHARNNDK